MAIDRDVFAQQCVRKGRQCGANPYYLLGVAQLRSGISDESQGDSIGPFRLTQAEWNANAKNAKLAFDFEPTDIKHWAMQCSVFAAMAADAFTVFASAKGRNPSARELYLQQFPDAPTATLSTDLQAALDATAALVDPAADAVLDPDDTAPSAIGNADQPAASAGSGVFNARANAFFTSLVAGGFFSSTPDDTGIRRSIRTNNPGALNISNWQRKRIGFAGITGDDGKGNRTTIYSTPEYGIAAWYHLLAGVYGFAKTGAFMIDDLAHKYDGAGAAQATINNYVSAWCKLSDAPLTASSVVQLTDDNQMLNLACAMYRNEAGVKLPWSNAQILFGIRNERSNTLPPPPKAS
jgi:hypothetical protein